MLQCISRRGRLAIKAVMTIGERSDAQHPLASKQLADLLKLPERYLENLLQKLVHDKILKSVRGPRGGYQLGREAEKITALDILMSLNASEKEAADPMLDPIVLDEREFFEGLRIFTIEKLIADYRRHKFA